MNPLAIGVVVMFGCFGLMAAYVLLKPAPQVVVVAPSATPPTASAPPPPTAPSASPPPTEPLAAAPAPSASIAVVDMGPVGKPGSTATRPGGPPSTGPATTKPTAGAITDPALRDLIGSTSSGPTAGPGGVGGGGGAQLTEDEIKQVVSQHNLGVRRTCWDRTSSTTPSVNVTVHIVIAGNGSVTSASSQGNDPVVGHCLEEEIRRWRWPGGGEVNVPFHFLRQ